VLLVALMLGPVFVLAFNRPKMLGAVGGVPRAEVRRRLLSAGAISVDGCSHPTDRFFRVELLPVAMNGLMVAVLFAVLLDVFEEIDARRRVPELVPIWPFTASTRSSCPGDASQRRHPASRGRCGSAR